MFSDVVSERSRGATLAEFIKKMDVVGELYETKSSVNPRTGNTIKVWLWRVDHEKFRKWYVEEYANRIEE
jgi:hypothetical protein